MSAQKLTLDQLNSATEAGFVAALGGIFEHSPWVAAAVARQRPFKSLDALNRAMQAEVDAAPAERKLALIKSHPDLAGKAAQAGTMTAESKSEQGGAGLDRLSKEEFERFQTLNAAYREKFDFPFIICVRMQDKDSILRAFETRLRNGPDAEFKAALREISLIASLRLQQLFAPAS